MLRFESLAEYIGGLEAQVVAKADRVERLALLLGDVPKEHPGGFCQEALKIGQSEALQIRPL